MMDQFEEIIERLTVAQIEAKRLSDAMDVLGQYQAQTADLIRQLVFNTSGKEL